MCETCRPGERRVNGTKFAIPERIKMGISPRPQSVIFEPNADFVLRIAASEFKTKIDKHPSVPA